MNTGLALVTGATGCLGRHVIGKLAAAGYQVRASGRNETIGRQLANNRITFMAGDLCLPGHAARLAAGADVIFHCAALSAPWGRAADFQASNVEATRLLLAAAQSSGCRRFVHVSTPSVTFRYADQLAIREDAPLPSRFVNSYAASKAEAERLVAQASGERLATVMLRPRAIFGEHDTTLIPRLLRVARTGFMPMFRNGSAMVDVSYAGNVADAMLLAGSPGAAAGLFNVSNGEPMSVRELLTRTFAALGRRVRLVPVPYSPLVAVAAVWERVASAGNFAEPRVLPYTLGVLAYSQTLDISAARERLGYAPKISVTEGLARYARWLASEGEPVVRVVA